MLVKDSTRNVKAAETPSTSGAGVAFVSLPSAEPLGLFLSVNGAGGKQDRALDVERLRSQGHCSRAQPARQTYL